MKNELLTVLITLILINAIFCTAFECDEEEDQEKCSQHSIEYEGFSCYKLKNIETTEDGNEEVETSCTSFPDEAGNQKAFINFVIGWMKESFSSLGGYFDGERIEDDPDYPYIYQLNKQSYSKGEEIIITEAKFSEEDINIITSKNTCSYLLYGRHVDNILDYQKNNNMENYTGYPNITDKNICFKAAQFPELTNLIDCGYAEIKYFTGDEEYKINSCFYIPNDKIPETIKSYFKTNFIDSMMDPEDGDSFLSLIFGEGLSGDDGDDVDDGDDDDERRRRRLSAFKGYQITVEDKNGKKLQYKTGEKGITVVSEGSNQSRWIPKYNIILLSLILLFL